MSPPQSGETPCWKKNSPLPAVQSLGGPFHFFSQHMSLPKISPFFFLSFFVFTYLSSLLPRPEECLGGGVDPKGQLLDFVPLLIFTVPRRLEFYRALDSTLGELRATSGGGTPLSCRVNGADDSREVGLELRHKT